LTQARVAAHAVLDAGELKPGQIRAVEVDGLSIALARKRDGSYRALRNRCPHQGAPLSEGKCEAYLVGPDVGAYARSEDRDVLRCPWHHFEFDLDNGRSITDPDRYRVRSYPTRVEDGMVVVDR
jgi:3-phenylpropionate/trans-cinnamate dioxygenase ferredoxin subunit